MGIGKKTRIQAKRDRREISREKYKAELIKTICLIFIVGLIASLILVKVVFIIYPIISGHVKDFIKSYRSSNENLFLKKKLRHEDFKSLYFQKEPILFVSSQRDAHTEATWAYLEAICSRDTSQSTTEHEWYFGRLTCRSEGDNHDKESTACQNRNGPIIFNFSSSATMETVRSIISTPRLVTHKNETKAIANFRNEISLELLGVPSSSNLDTSAKTDSREAKRDGKRGASDSSAYPTFQQHPQSWSELIVGRKQWYLYRPGTSLDLELYFMIHDVVFRYTFELLLWGNCSLHSFIYS